MKIAVTQICGWLSPGRIIFCLAACPLAVAGIVFLGERAVNKGAEGRVFSSAEKIPHRPVGLVLGCARTLADGRENLYFRYRMDAAAELFNSGKVDVLIVSGDNHRTGYDEPTEMKDALVSRGIPAARIQCDYAGFRTLDSIVRAKKVFCADRITVVSQRFHGQRAAYVGRARGLDVLVFAARDVSRRAGFRTCVRERLARVKAVLDVSILDKQPKFLGEKIPVVATGAESGHPGAGIR